MHFSRDSAKPLTVDTNTNVHGATESMDHKPATKENKTREEQKEGEKTKTNTPVKADRLNEYLEGYDEKLREYIVNGFKYGFSLDYTGGNRSLKVPKNLKSAEMNEAIVREKIDKEIKLNV